LPSKASPAPPGKCAISGAISNAELTVCKIDHALTVSTTDARAVKARPSLQVFTGYFRSGNTLGWRGAILRGDATTRETKYELVLKIIAGLKLNDETPHIQKLQLCIALARGVLDLKPGEQRECVSRDKPKIPYEKRN